MMYLLGIPSSAPYWDGACLWREASLEMESIGTFARSFWAASSGRRGTPSSSSRRQPLVS